MNSKQNNQKILDNAFLHVFRRTKGTYSQIDVEKIVDESTQHLIKHIEGSRKTITKEEHTGFKMNDQKQTYVVGEKDGYNKALQDILDYIKGKEL